MFLRARLDWLLGARVAAAPAGSIDGLDRDADAQADVRERDDHHGDHHDHDHDDDHEDVHARGPGDASLVPS